MRYKSDQDKQRRLAQAERRQREIFMREIGLPRIMESVRKIEAWARAKRDMREGLISHG